MKHIDKEYCLPYDNTNPEFWMRIEHLGRYLYATDYIKKHSCTKVLDAACSNGYGCFEMLSPDTEVFGIDYNEDLIISAKTKAQIKRFSNVRFIKSDLNTDDLSWLTPVDLVTCFDTLEHLIDPASFLKKLNSVMHQYATLLLSVPKAKYEPVDEHGNPTNDFHLHRFSLSALSSMLDDSGFSTQKTLYQPYTNMCMSLEKNVVRDTDITIMQTREFYADSEDALRFFARMFALPVPDLDEYSYSVFVVAKKL